MENAILGFALGVIVSIMIGSILEYQAEKARILEVRLRRLEQRDLLEKKKEKK